MDTLMSRYWFCTVQRVHNPLWVLLHDLRGVPLRDAQHWGSVCRSLPGMTSGQAHVPRVLAVRWASSNPFRSSTGHLLMLLARLCYVPCPWFGSRGSASPHFLSFICLTLSFRISTFVVRAALWDLSQAQSGGRGMIEPVGDSAPVNDTQCADMGRILNGSIRACSGSLLAASHLWWLRKPHRARGPCAWWSTGPLRRPVTHCFMYSTFRPGALVSGERKRTWGSEKCHGIYIFQFYTL